MSIMPFQVTLWIELRAAGLGGVHGALFAAGARPRRIDVLGVIVIGLAVSLGGSLLRDIVLDQPPVVVWKNWYLIVAGASAILGMVLQPVLVRADWLITVLLDAVVMGLFGAIAASKALSLGVGESEALAVGVIGAIGGVGLLRRDLPRGHVRCDDDRLVRAIGRRSGAAGQWRHRGSRVPRGRGRRLLGGPFGAVRFWRAWWCVDAGGEAAVHGARSGGGLLYPRLGLDVPDHPGGR
jgi:hypothetical protein